MLEGLFIAVMAQLSSSAKHAERGVYSHCGAHWKTATSKLTVKRGHCDGVGDGKVKVEVMFCLGRSGMQTVAGDKGRELVLYSARA